MPTHGRSWRGAVIYGIGHQVSPKVVRFDPESLEFSTELSFDTNPRGLVFGGGRIWVATEDGLYAIDPATDEVARVTEFGPVGHRSHRCRVPRRRRLGLDRVKALTARDH
jgi:hypothetical protein